MCEDEDAGIATPVFVCKSYLDAVGANHYVVALVFVIIGEGDAEASASLFGGDDVLLGINVPEGGGGYSGADKVSREGT